MGIEYCHYLLPRPNGFMPTAGQLLAFLNRAIADGWIPKQNGLRRHRAREKLPLTELMDASWLQKDTQLVWKITHFGTAGLHYPLMPVDRWESLDEAYYDIILEWSPDYIYRQLDGVDPFVNVTCSCRAELELRDSLDTRDVFYATFIRSQCHRCGRQTDISTWPARIRDGLTGEEQTIAGGASSRFALAIDCGKGFPSESHMVLKPEIVTLFQETFGCGTKELGFYY